MSQFQVHPSEKVTEQTIKLSICDVYLPKVWVMLNNFWTLQENTSPQDCLDHLKEGLSRTITECPLLAGNLDFASDDPRDLVVNVKPDAWVEFSYEDLSGREEIPSYASLKAEAFPMTELRAPLQPETMQAQVTVGSPTFVAKLNHLAGGMVLTFAVNHAIADAAAVGEIERLWSLHTADASRGVAQQLHKKFTSDIEIRQKLSTPISGAGDFKRKHWKELPTAASQLHLPKEKAAPGDESKILDYLKAKLVGLEQMMLDARWCIWHFNAESLARLKKDASPPDSSQWVSTNDALLGLFWSRMASVKKASKQGRETSTGCFPLGFRQRLSPAVDQHFVGNLVDIVSTECQLADLESPEKGLVTGAQGIRRAVTQWDQAEWEAWLTKACTLPAETVVCFDNEVLLDPINVICNDRSKSNSYQLNWGESLGYIDRVRMSDPAAKLIIGATALIVFPKMSDGAMEVACICTNGVRAALEHDEVIKRYATLSSKFA